MVLPYSYIQRPSGTLKRVLEQFDIKVRFRVNYTLQQLLVNQKTWYHLSNGMELFTEFPARLYHGIYPDAPLFAE